MTFEFFKNFYKRTRTTKKKRSVIAQRNIIILITSWNVFIITTILVPLLISRFSSVNIHKQNVQFKISTNKNTKANTIKSIKPTQNTRVSSFKPNIPSKLTTKPKLSTLLFSNYSKSTTTTQRELQITTIKATYNRISIIQFDKIYHKIAAMGEYLAVALKNKLRVIDKDGRTISEKDIGINNSIASLGSVSNQEVLVGFSNGLIGLYQKKEFKFIKTGCHDTVSMFAPTNERNLFLYAAGKLICSVHSEKQEVNRVISSCRTAIEALHVRGTFIVTAHKNLIELRQINGQLYHSFTNNDNQITSFTELLGIMYSNSLNKNAIIQWNIENSQIVNGTEIIRSENSVYHIVKMSSRFVTCGEKVVSWKKTTFNKWLPDEIDEKIGLVRSLAVLSFQIIAGSTDDGKIIFWKAKF